MNLTTSKPSVWLQPPRDSNRVPLWPGELPELTQPLNSYGPVPCHSRTWEHGCSLHDDGKFLACRISLEFPNSNFIRLWWSSGKMLCLLDRWCGFDSRARHSWQAKFGHELHWWRDSLKNCVGPVCPSLKPDYMNLAPTILGTSEHFRKGFGPIPYKEHGRKKHFLIC